MRAGAHEIVYLLATQHLKEVMKMAIQASANDKTAYAMLGGAIDNTASVWTFTSEGLKLYNKYSQAHAPGMSVAQVIYDKMMYGTKLAPSALSAFLAKADFTKKCYDYLSKVKDALDESKRDGTVFKLGIKVSLDLAKKWLGVSLTTHPYFTYHKVMLDALADALNAARNSREAVASYRRAVSAATSKAVAAEFNRLEGRKVDLVAAHLQFRDRLGVAADIARGMYQGQAAEAKIQQYGGTDRISEALADLEAWRAMWAGLSFDSMSLVIMAGSELHVAEAAMQKVRSLLSKLMSGQHTVDVVAGYGATNAIEWEKYDQIVGEKAPDQAAFDPVGFAQSTSDKAVAWAGALADMCDFVRSDQVYFPTKFNSQLDRLNKVLYGLQVGLEEERGHHWNRAGSAKPS
jgi:hypothetical protein